MSKSPTSGDNNKVYGLGGAGHNSSSSGNLVKTSLSNLFKTKKFSMRNKNSQGRKVSPGEEESGNKF